MLQPYNTLSFFVDVLTPLEHETLDLSSVGGPTPLTIFHFICPRSTAVLRMVLLCLLLMVLLRCHSAPPYRRANNRTSPTTSIRMQQMQQHTPYLRNM